MKFSKIKQEMSPADQCMKEVSAILQKYNCVMHAVPDYQIMIVEKKEEKDAFEKVDIKEDK